LRSVSVVLGSEGICPVIQPPGCGWK